MTPAAALAPSAWQPFVRDGSQGWDRPADWRAKSALRLVRRER